MQHLSEEQRQLMEWTKDQPISVYQLDLPDRVVLKIADERDAIQKKTFTKWVNKHLKKHWRFIQSGRTVHDLFEDLQDGHNLLSLLEVLSGELLSRERGRMRFHKVQNCNAALQFLKYRKIKVVNIRPEDIVDGNPKLTLGLIWTIILHFQISVNISGNANQVEQQYQELNAREARNALLVWARDSVKGYPGVSCKDFSRSWRDGLAFNALLHRHRPHLIDFRVARQRTNRENLELAFGIAEKEFGVTRLLDAEDVDTPEPDDKSIITYVSSLYDVLGNSTPQLEQVRETRTNAYVDQAVSLHTWTTQTISRLHSKYESSGVRETQSLLAECASIRSDELPRKLDVKNQLSELYYELENLYINVPSIPVKEDIQPATLDKLWRMLLVAIEQREKSLQDDLRRCEKLRPKAEATCRSVLIIDGRLKNMKDLMKQDEQRIRSLKNPYEAKSICDTYDTELREIELSITATMTDAKLLRDSRYYDCETIYRSVLEIERKFVTIRTTYQEGIVAQLAGKTFTSEEKFVTKRTEKISSTRLVDHREQRDDSGGSSGSLSDDTASHNADGSLYLSTPVSRGRYSETNGIGAPVVQIQAYSDREHAGVPISVKSTGKDTPAAPKAENPRKSGSTLVHGRNADPLLNDPEDTNRKRATSLLTPDLAFDSPKRSIPNPDDSPPTKKDHYYFGGTDPSQRNTGDDAATRYDAGRRPSKEIARVVQSEATFAAGDAVRRNGGGFVVQPPGMSLSTTQSNGHPVVDGQVRYADAKVNGQVVDQAALAKKARSDSLKEKANQVMTQLEVFTGGLNGLDHRCTDMLQWISHTRVALQKDVLVFSTVAAVQQALDKQTELQRTISGRATEVASLRKDIDDAKSHSKGLTTLLNEHRQYMTGNPPPIYAKCNELNAVILQIVSSYDQLASEATLTHQNLQCLVDLLSAYQAHLEEATQWINHSERQVFEAEALPNDKVGVELAKLRFEELGRQTGEFQNQMDRLSAIYGDIQMRTDNRAEQVRDSQDKVMERWRRLREACNERMRNLDSVSFFLHSCEQLLVWLTQKQKMISVLGPISYDVALLDHQKQQVDVILEELRAQRSQISRLHDESGQLLSQTKESERAGLITKLNQVDDLWTESVHSLEARRRQIENAVFASQVFVDSFHTLEVWLGKITALYEKFVQVDDLVNAERQLAELTNIENELNSQTYLLANAENAGATLCEVLANDVTSSEIESKLQHVKKQYTDLKKRNEALKSGLEKNVKDGKEFDLACNDMANWFQSINDRMKPNVKISALLDVLTHQVKAFSDVHDEINRKESEMHALTIHGKELVAKAPGDIASSIQERLEGLQADWQDVNQRANSRSGVLQNALEQARRYQVAVEVFVPFLQKAEHSVAGFTPISFRKVENAEQLLHVQELRSAIRAHSVDLDAVQQQGTVLVGICEADTEGVTEEVMDIQARWDAVEQVTMKRVRSLEDVSHRLTEYEDAMDSFQVALAKCEEKLQVAEEAEPDQKTMENMVALQDEVESMKRQIDFVEDFGHGLLTDGIESDVRHIEEELISARRRYDELENKIGESITFLEGATTAVTHFVEYLKQTENCVNELEDELDNMGPEGKDLDTILNQIDEVVRFEKNIDATVKEVQDAESALGDLVDSHYAHSAETWKEQIGGMFEQLENLAIRAQNRASDLDVAREKLEEFQHTLENVMRSLAQDGEEGLDVPLDGRTNYIHEQFFQRLDGLLAALNNTAEKLANCEPISALPGKLQKQIEENTRLIEDLGKRSHSYESAKRAASDLAKLASSDEDEATVGSIQGKLASLDDMWITILKDTEDRGRSLEDTYRISVKFWEELGNVTELIKELETALLSQEPPAVEIPVIRSQQDALQELKDDLNQSQPDYAHVVTAGQELIDLCGEPDKPEVKKSIEELDHVWGNITQLFLQRDNDLVDAMEKSMSFHGLLQSLTQFLEEAEEAFRRMGHIGAETDTVKEQMEQLKEFRAEMEPHTVDVESLMTQADELIMRTSVEQAEIVSLPVFEIEQRWESLWAGVNERQYELENALVRLGQFRHALSELISWIVEKDAGLDAWTIPFGDSKTIELEMARHKVLLNDLAANQNSVDILNEAGHGIIEASEENGEDAKATQTLLDDLEQKWEELLQKAELKQSLLEDRLKEAESFQDEIQDKLNWLTEKDQHLIASKPVGGLPQSAKDQLNNFMDLFTEIEGNKPVIESILKRGAEYLETAPEGMSAGLDHNLKTLKHRWDAALTKANDRKIKLEIAVRDAVEFYDTLQAFTLWLTNAEKTQAAAKPPSRIMEVVLQQIEEHKTFQEDVGDHLAAQNALDKKGTTLKYFSQKQDVVQIKNLLASVQQRWDKLISASADRQRSLTSAHLEGKEFNRHYAEMLEWLDMAENSLDGSAAVPSDAEKIRAQLIKHKDFQKQLTAKQGALNGISKMGRMLKESAAKSEQTVIQTMLTDLQKKWKTVGTKSAERQRKLEEALLFTGQLREALHSMLEWLNKIEPLLAESMFVHGDIDNVKVLDEHHKALENDLSNRAANMAIVRKAAKELTSSGDVDAATAGQLAELEQKWSTVQDLADKRRAKLNDALRDAMDFHQVLHSLIEWLGATEMKIRVFKALPDDVKDVQMAIFEIHEYQSDMQARQSSLDKALTLGDAIQKKCHPDSVATIRHWLKVLNTRWQEVDILMKQREQRLKDHMNTLEKSVEELEQLLVWFFSVEANLIAAEQQDFPHDLETTKRLMNEHQDLETELYAKQMAVERLTQPRPQSNESLNAVDKKGRRTAGQGGRKPGEPVFFSDNARDLYYRNRDVTARAVERRNQLQDHFSHMLALEKLKGFQFEDWRRKFVRFMNVKKLRVMDFFRRYDTDRDGRLTREEFIKCILDEKFQTTELELEIVANVFDQNGDGLIDYQEFLHALKPDWKSAQNLTEADKIEDELTFQTRNCTCEHPHHYELQRKKDSQGAVQSYIFSDTQQLRLVRILHTTIMVRVGGGWETLDKFLVKNDPCRIKGRTNVELRETFILPEGSSQAMTPFKNKKPSGIFKEADPSDPRLSSVGPISKIRVKTVHTTPWKGGSKALETCSDPGGNGTPHHHLHAGQIPHSHTHTHLMGGGLTFTNNAKTKKPTSRPPSRAASEAPEEQPSHSSHSTHSRSSSISSTSGPSVAASTSSKTPSALAKNTNGTTGAKNGKTPAKTNGNPRKR